MTNADKINRMSNKELASVLADLLEKNCAGNMCLCYGMSGSNTCCGGCSIGIENWLGLPCKDEAENPPADNPYADVDRTTKWMPKNGEEYAIPEISRGVSFMGRLCMEWYA